MICPALTPCHCQVRISGPALQHTWGLRDLLAIKYTPACITVVAHDSGRLLWQNAASMAMFGEGRWLSWLLEALRLHLSPRST